MTKRLFVKFIEWQEKVFKLTGMEIPTAKADAAIKGLSTGEYNNILIVTLIQRK